MVVRIPKMQWLRHPLRRNTSRIRRSIASIVLCLVSSLFPVGALAASSAPKPFHLTCDSLINPLGIDDPKPAFSWQLQDASYGARQTAYELRVATSPLLLAAGKPDVWNSGKVASDRSVDVPYSGPALQPERRYYWQVKAWNQGGSSYPASDPAWWETGLGDSSKWRARWIGYEAPEDRMVREAGALWISNVAVPGAQNSSDSRHDFRLNFSLDKPVKRADLFVTGQDTPAAWLNGRRVLQTQAQLPWKQFPWKRYTREDVSGEVQTGANVLAVEITTYAIPDWTPGSAGQDGLMPMNACLYVEATDGTAKIVCSSPQWKAMLNAGGNWFDPGFDDAEWKNAIAYEAPPSPLNPWQAEMGRPWLTGAVKMLRREFTLRSPVTSARLYATALGAYAIHINGRRVGDEILAPGWTDYRERDFYQTYDVTADLKDGRNAIAAFLAPGWYSTPLMWTVEGNSYGTTPPSLKAQLRIQHADGSVEWIATDASWKADDSAILKAEIYDGETYDARRDQPGWDTPGFAAANWKPVEVIQPLEPRLLAQNFQPIRVERVMIAKGITSPSAGVYIYDFGQNFSGVPKLRVHGTAGEHIRLRFAEVLNPDGTLYVENLRNAKVTDDYILAGKGMEEFQPEFTFHGFRYAEISGIDYKPGLNTLKAVVFHTDAPFTLSLHSGSAMVNQLWSNILWSQRSNFMSVPTDCPQRDERLGWTGDAEVFWRTASYNMNLTQFSKKFAGDLRGTQVGTPMYGMFAPGTNVPNPGYSPGWSDAGVIVPWTAWIQSGDTRVIEENWDAMQKYLSAIESANPDYLWSNNFGSRIGDWLSPEGKTKELLIATAYWGYDISLMQQMAHALGKTEDEQKYAGLHAKIKQAFGRTFVRGDGYISSADNTPSPFGQLDNPDAKSQGGDTQTGYALALYMDMVPDALRRAAGDRLVGKIQAFHGQLGTGFLGTPYLLAALVDTGHSDVAYRLLLNRQYPSWGYMIDHGATTMWERWNGDRMFGDPSMNSFNHYGYGAVGAWIYRYAAGVDALPQSAGFHVIDLHPNFDSRLGSLDLSYDSPYGKIRSAWTERGTRTDWFVTIPPNATAHLTLSPEQVAAFTLDGSKLAVSRKARLLGRSDGQSTYLLQSGSYFFQIAAH